MDEFENFELHAGGLAYSRFSMCRSHLACESVCGGCNCLTKSAVVKIACMKLADLPFFKLECRSLS